MTYRAIGVTGLRGYPCRPFSGSALFEYSDAQPSYSVCVIILRRAAAIVVAVVAIPFLIGAVVLTIAGDLAELILVALCLGMLTGAWRLWPHHRQATHPASAEHFSPAAVGVNSAASSTSHAEPINHAGQPNAATLIGEDFAVVDVETANRSMASICAIAVAQVRGGVIADTFSWLVQPPAGHDTFDRRNVSIHGISASRVAYEGHPWATVIHDVISVIGTDVVVAHNASFDSAAINAAASACGLPAPALVFADSLELARDVMPHLPNHKLPTVAQACGVVQRRHHDAADDARVCAEITAFLLAGAAQTETLPELSITPEAERNRADPSHPLFGKSIVITGDLATMSKHEAEDGIIATGGQLRGSVTKTTDYLVEGVRTGLEASPDGSKKRLRALELQAAGHHIQLIDEAHLQALLHG